MVIATCLLVVSCVIWAVNLVCSVLSYWIPHMLDASFALLIITMIEWFLMIFIGSKNGMDNSLIQDETPTIFVILLVVSIFYTVGNSFISILILWEGGPRIEDGVYCLWNHGFIREITKEEYDYLSLVESRFTTGHILAFSAGPMSVFSAIRERKILQKYVSPATE